MMPLAERMRPQILGDVVGQEHLIATGKIIHEIIAKITNGKPILNIKKDSYQMSYKASTFSNPSLKTMWLLPLQTLIN